MKKALSSIAFIAVFGAYMMNHYFGATSAAPVSAPVSAPASAPIATKPSASSGSSSGSGSGSSAKKSGLYADGTYTGSVADAYYGNIQVEAKISGGKIADVVFLQYPNDRSTSRFINGQAMPMLKSEAIQAQSAKVNGVSGATDTSSAFRQSLSSALMKARA